MTGRRQRRSLYPLWLREGPMSRRSIAVDAQLVERAERLSVDVRRAAEAGIRSAVERADDADPQAWIERHKAALERKAKRDRDEGLANESLRAF